MSKNNKNARLIAERKRITAMHQAGNKGPSRTASKHTKKRAWWQIFPSYGAYIRGEKRADRQRDQSAQPAN